MPATRGSLSRGLVALTAVGAASMAAVFAWTAFALADSATAPDARYGFEVIDPSSLLPSVARTGSDTDGAEDDDAASFLSGEGGEAELRALESALEALRANRSVEADGAGGADGTEPPFYRCNPSAFLSGGWQLGRHGGGAEDPKDVPLVSVTTATRGERQFERNTWLNVRYSAWPPSRLELVIIDSSARPSAFFRALANASAHPAVVYRHFPAPVRGFVDMWIGKARNTMTKMARGDIVISMDSDDIYPPSYIPFMVHSILHGERGLSASSQTHLLALESIRHAFVHPSGSWKITGLQKAASIGGHHIAYWKGTTCTFAPVGSSEELSMFRCNERRRKLRRVSPPPEAAMIKVNNPVSITLQLFYLGREVVTPLDPADWHAFLSASERFYEAIHSTMRPPCILPEPSPASEQEEGGELPKPRPRGPEPGLDSEVSGGTSSRRQGPLYETSRLWREHIRSSHAPCERLSRLPGQRIKEEYAANGKIKTKAFPSLALGNRSSHALADPVAGAMARRGERLCCQACDNDTMCTVYEYAIREGRCRLAIRDIPEPCKGKRPCGISATYLVSGAILSHATGVKDVDCSRCAKKSTLATEKIMDDLQNAKRIQRK
mmetsp:Transcript_16579/g.40832  ORF Transcript_16579/g.40832 Transcript_16579/m.40832 type:complete len:610 (+) Transcript_16579:83-1912(+)